MTSKATWHLIVIIFKFRQQRSEVLQVPCKPSIIASQIIVIVESDIFIIAIKIVTFSLEDVFCILLLLLSPFPIVLTSQCLLNS